MIIKTNVDNLEERLKSEFDYLQNKYKSVAFNMYDWWSKPNNRSNGKNILLAVEGYITIPNNYNPSVINQYDVFITHNSKFKELNPDLNIVLQNAPANWENYYQLESFLTYDQKIKGICCLARVYNTGTVGDINYMKHNVMRDLNVEPELVVHTYGQSPFGRPESYQGYLGFKHSHFKNLEKINQYLFCWCPEPMYHELWSHDYVTERLFNCFKSKTVAVYYGCYNIQDKIPPNLYIDYRNFKNTDELSQYLIEFSKDKEKYTEMVESAYQWNLTNKLGDIKLLEDIIQDCVKKYPI